MPVTPKSEAYDTTIMTTTINMIIIMIMIILTIATIIIPILMTIIRLITQYCRAAIAWAQLGSALWGPRVAERKQKKHFHVRVCWQPFGARGRTLGFRV